MDGLLVRQTCWMRRLNLALLTLGARNVSDNRIPVPFALVSNPRTHSRKSARR